MEYSFLYSTEETYLNVFLPENEWEVEKYTLPANFRHAPYSSIETELIYFDARSDIFLHLA